MADGGDSPEQRGKKCSRKWLSDGGIHQEVFSHQGVNAPICFWARMPGARALMYDRVKRDRSRRVPGSFGYGARYRRTRLPSTVTAAPFWMGSRHRVRLLGSGVVVAGLKAAPDGSGLSLSGWRPWLLAPAPALVCQTLRSWRTARAAFQLRQDSLGQRLRRTFGLCGAPAALVPAVGAQTEEQVEYRQ